MKFQALALCRVACLSGAVLSTVAFTAVQAQAPQTYMYILMVNMVGPAANSLARIAGKQEMSDQDWTRVKEMVARLNDSSASVATGGNSAAEEERARSPEWKAWSARFTATVSSTAEAAERKDRTALLAANDALVAACEGCHTAFPPAAPR
jgi:cytochrome c556